MRFSYEWNENFSQRIQTLIDHFGLSQKDFATKVKLGKNTIWRWIKGQPGKEIEEKSIDLVVNNTECNKNWLLYGDEHMFPSYTPPAGLTINFDLGKNKPLADLHPKQQKLAEWIELQDDDMDYWGWLEVEFSEKFADYKKWSKELNKEKKQGTGTDN